MSDHGVFDEFLKAYGPPAGEEGPVLFVREVLGAEPDPWQEDVMREYGRGGRRISIRACHGPGKTAVAAWIVLHQLLTRFPQKSVATAPSVGQLEDALVAEVEKWFKRLPEPLRMLFSVKKNRIELRAAPEESFFTARTARQENPEALQGVHSDHVLLVADEASGVPEQIFEAAAGSMSGHNATTLLLSNPVRPSGFFFDTHHKLSDMWFTVQVSAEDSPRVTDDFVYDIARRYGEDSDAYRIRVLGEFPASGLNTIVPYDLAASAQQRDIVVPETAVPVWGCDIARFGDDDNVLLKRNPLEVEPDIQVWRGVDLMKTAGRIKLEYDETAPSKRPQEILIDSIGLGAGVADRLRELGLPVRDINVSETSAMRDKYRNLRTELWFSAREWLNSKNRRLPTCDATGGCATDCPHERLVQELVSLQYTYTSTGKLMAESKTDLKKRGYKSPNVADAFVLTFAGEPASLAGGENAEWRASWNRPLKRGLSHV